jgi:6-phosphogluconate dehydrogenase
MQMGIIGLGRMGASMVRRLMRVGHECVMYDANADAVARGVMIGSEPDIVAAALSQPYDLDVTHPKASKGEAIAALSTLLTIPSVQVQRAAKFVTSSNTEEGFALAMERVVLGAGSVH